MTPSKEFLAAFNRIDATEAGFQNDPNDRGNWALRNGKSVLVGTNHGVAAATHPNEDIRNLTIERAQEIYYEEYWKPVEINLFTKALTYQVMDAAINHGTYASNQILQRAAKVFDDGDIGPKTKSAIAMIDENDMLMLFIAERMDTMRSYKSFSIYGNGWMGRIAKNLRFAAEDNTDLPRN